MEESCNPDYQSVEVSVTITEMEPYGNGERRFVALRPNGTKVYHTEISLAAMGYLVPELPGVQHGKRLAYLHDQHNEANEVSSDWSLPPDNVAAAAMALIDNWGWYMEPVFNPETVLEIAEIVAKTLQTAPFEENDG